MRKQVLIFVILRYVKQNTIFGESIKTMGILEPSEIVRSLSERDGGLVLCALPGTPEKPHNLGGCTI